MSRTPPRRIWLTGAGSGIGAALAEELLTSGAHLALSARAVAPLQALSARFPGQVLLVPGDLTNSQQVREIGERIGEAWGSLDSLILNAGTCEYVDARQHDSSIIEHVVRTNLLASSYCIEASLPLLRAGNTPHLVGIASSVTWLPLPRTADNGACNSGLRSMFESLRIDLAPQGIDVTVLSPGFVNTPSIDENDVPMPQNWPLDKAARHALEEIQRRPPTVAFAALNMAGFWPLPK
ncbi:putative oxidoreductase [Pseudomonas fluorescens]|uniref:Putative oxidoreductase n=1 Tax=Pseudomonas fluorescens TaxID=294 RepID=A0A5E7ADK3_PSEFL|nr:putative oxidoreductase [Pseudomonas fluorescens]